MQQFHMSIVVLHTGGTIKDYYSYIVSDNHDEMTLLPTWCYILNYATYKLSNLQKELVIHIHEAWVRWMGQSVVAKYTDTETCLLDFMEEFNTTAQELTTIIS